jgi:hypothetical protein
MRTRDVISLSPRPPVDFRSLRSDNPRHGESEELDARRFQADLQYHSIPEWVIPAARQFCGSFSLEVAVVFEVFKVCIGEAIRCV